MTKKMFRMDIAYTQNEANGIGAAYGFNFNADRVALAEALDVDDVVVFVDHSGDPGEIGWRLNVVRNNGGDMQQWTSRDSKLCFIDALAWLGRIATLPVYKFWPVVSQDCEQVI